MHKYNNIKELNIFIRQHQMGIVKIYRNASKRKQIKKQKKKSWKENETSNKFYEQDNYEEDDSYVQR